ncbi:putative hemoglobin and hemoglobin-haptoglobin-binding protein 2 [Pseudidiomarina piscicola]|uniref:Putative hemoglobin and hemoglobin-haptoglobin-binding protein 2 n=1 Tax=Pseudidiomarina piscicola TaxID=2614830 RepID=A0A776AJB0_9GAMM|nr:TonB-dependent receptor [Pseudidiomarina piscicola]CAB0151776.1 putative hemoglobin and hemoglobin-haptoglobin-binding protein 2 [Pseudidiomarina piscicola]VZT41229.1 putative hemoglobin and hemoglobin-haptoglobin-binding protein 2 [Pseudomonas aeruginosa]
MATPHHRLTNVCSALMLAVALPATAQQTSNDSDNTILPDEIITVVAHRQARALSEVAGTVSVLSDAELERDLVFNASDLIRYEMGVELDDTTHRFGYSGFRIRGVGGNRTAIVVDQVAIADRFAVGSFSDTGRGLLDLGLANRVEILRGPASTLYGSDALGGVVAVQTLQPEDVLTTEHQGTRVRLGYGSDADRGYGRVATALSSGNHSLLMAAAVSHNDEVEAKGLEGDQLDPQKTVQRAALLKWHYLTDQGELKLSFDALREQRDSQIKHSLGTGRQASTTALSGDDERYEWRAILSFDSAATAFYDQGQWRVFLQQAQTQQNSFEERGRLAEPVSIFRGFRYDYSNYGAAADLEFETQLLGLSQRIGYGFEWSQAEVWDERDAWQFNQVTQQTTKTLLGETFPLRDFPRSKIQELGLYLHDEIKLWRGGPTVSPGLRYEYYDLATQADELFDLRYPNTAVTDLTHTAWLPKLGVLWPLGPQAEWFAQYARGYRAPPFADVNVGLYYPQFRVLAIANPDLKPERGYTFETGLRWRAKNTELTLTGYHNRFSDFIDSRAAQGFDPQQQLLIFQSVNRDKVVIEGLELSWKQQWNRRWESQLWLDYSQGEDRTTGQDVASVSPPSMLAEVNYAAPSGAWETRFILRAQQGQKQLYNVDDEALYAAPGYATMDWLVQWFPSHQLQVGAGVFNLADRKYWNPIQVGNYPQDDPIIPIMAAAGRHVKATVNYRF